MTIVHAAIRPEDVVAGVKNHMGEKKIIKKVGNVEYTPEAISSLIIKKLVQDSERATGQKIGEVVITVPAYFSDCMQMAGEFPKMSRQQLHGIGRQQPREIKMPLII